MTRHAAVVGVDPGLQGAIAFVRLDMGDASVHDLPVLDRKIDIFALSEMLEQVRERFDLRLCLIESAMILPRQNAISGLTVGRNYGRLAGCIELARVPLQEVTPATWKRQLFGVKKTGVDRKAIKEAAISKARMMFPHLAHSLLKSKDGRAEALLLAELARQRLVGA